MRNVIFSCQLELEHVNRIFMMTKTNRNTKFNNSKNGETERFYEG